MPGFLMGSVSLWRQWNKYLPISSGLGMQVESCKTGILNYGVSVIQSWKIYMMTKCSTLGDKWKCHDIWNSGETHGISKWSGFDLWVGKIPWKREELPTPVFRPGEFHTQRSLEGYCPWDHKESDTTKPLTLSLSRHQLLTQITDWKERNPLL